MRDKSNPARLVRPSDALMPAGFLLACLLGHASCAALTFAAAFVISILSLFACHGARLAFAGQPSARSVRGSVKCALLLEAAALTVAVALCLIIDPPEKGVFTALLAAGFCLNIEHTFYEYLYAMGDPQGATLCRFIAALLLVAGLCLAGGDGDPLRAEWIAGTAALSALAALTVGLATGGVRGRINARVVACAPRAALHAGLYPLASAALAILFDARGFICSFFTGLILYALCQTPFRRAPSESVPMNRALLAACLAGSCAAVAALLLHVGSFPLGSETIFSFRPILDIPGACAALIVAAACAFALFGSIQRRERDEA